MPASLAGLSLPHVVVSIRNPRQPQLQQWAAKGGHYIGAVFIHGRSRQQR